MGIRPLHHSKMMRTVALLVVVGLASAARLTWNSDNCNTDFNNKANWEPKRSPKEDGTPPAGRVIFGTNDGTPFKPVNSFVVSGEYSMGELILPEDGILTLEGNGVTLNFVDENDGSDVYFAAGQKFSEACDFNCHKNWNTLNGQVSRKPACDGDVAVFAGDHTHKVWAQGIINLHSMKFGEDVVTNKYEIPDFQVFPEGDLLDVIFQDNKNCFDSGLIDPEQQKCFCHSTCVGEAEQLVQNSQQRTIAKEVAGEDQKDLLTPETREFYATFDWRNIARTAICAGAANVQSCQTDFESSIQCAMTGYNFTADSVIVPAIVGAVAANVPSASVSIAALSVSNNLLRIGGNVIAPFQFFRAPGPNGELRLTWSETWTYNVNPGVENLIAANIWRAFARSVLQCSYNSCSGDIALARSGCDAIFPGLCSEQMDNGIIAVSNEADVDANVDTLIAAAIESINKLPEAGLFSVGWDVDSPRSDLAIMAGDSIVFTWSGNRDLARVSQTTYDRCASGEYLDYSMGSDEELLADNTVAEYTYTAVDVGTFYFISTMGSGLDCSTGTIRLQVTVVPYVAPTPKVTFARDVITRKEGVTDRAYDDFLTNFADYLNSQSLGQASFPDIASEAKKYWATNGKCTGYISIQNRIPFPTPVKSSFPGTWAGMLLSQFDVNQIVNPLNAEAFKAYIARGLKGVAGITNVENVQVEMKDPKANLRRNINSTGSAVLILWISFDYTKFVLPTCRVGDDNINCLFAPRTRVTNFVNGVVDDLTTLYEIVFPDCFSTSSGFDQTCIASKLKNTLLDAYKANKKISDTQMRQLAETLYITIAGCGMKGALPDGTCIDPKAAAAAKVAASTAASTAVTEARKTIKANESNGNGGSQSSTSGSSGGLPIIPIAAGAGGGLLVIIIIVVVMRRRKGDVAPKGESSDRTVVAFENPMYDDPGQNPAAGSYDNGGLGGESEGLYDEPAFSQAAEAKQNPMYQSSEDLAAEADNENGGGYLDVAPEDQ